MLAGGQSLVPMLHMRLMRPEVLVDINAIPELDGIAVSNGCTAFGARVRYSAIETSALVAERLPLLASHGPARRRSPGPEPRHDRRQPRPGRPGRRDRRSPAWRSAPRSWLAARDGSREIADRASSSLGPYTTALEPDELLVEVRFPRCPRGGSRSSSSPGATTTSPCSASPRPRVAATAGWRRVRLALARRRRPAAARRPRRRARWRVEPARARRRRGRGAVLAGDRAARRHARVGRATGATCAAVHAGACSRDRRRDEAERRDLTPSRSGSP